MRSHKKAWSNSAHLCMFDDPQWQALRKAPSPAPPVSTPSMKNTAVPSTEPPASCVTVSRYLPGLSRELHGACTKQLLRSQGESSSGPVSDGPRGLQPRLGSESPTPGPRGPPPEGGWRICPQASACSLLPRGGGEGLGWLTQPGACLSAYPLRAASHSLSPGTSPTPGARGGKTPNRGSSLRCGGASKG